MLRFEATPIGKVLLTVVVVTIVGFAFLGSFAPRRFGRVLATVGFQQSWRVYAPEPIRSEVEFDAVISYSDGTTSTWRIPRSPALFPYLSHGWERWQSRIVTDGYSTWWPRGARWIAEHRGTHGLTPVRVVLRRRWFDLPAPGTNPSRHRWNELDFYTLDLR